MRIEETNDLGFSPGLITQTGLYSHRRRLEAWNFGFKKKRHHTGTIRLAKWVNQLCSLWIRNKNNTSQNYRS